MRGVDNVIPRKRHHNVMNGTVLSLLCSQYVCCGFRKRRERKDLVCLNWKVPLQNIKLKLLELGWNEFHH